MTVSEYFSENYAKAREKFRAAARGTGAALHVFEHPSERGPNGEQLTIDVAVVGPRDAASCLLIISGTHGVEGFAGSACQVGFFRDSLHAALGKNSCAVLVHALNPFGFAWTRRVNEQNVDLNRNFCDFAGALPANDDYLTLHSALIPTTWDGPPREAADNALKDFIGRRGLREFQEAVTAGQYTHPDGLFYGGTAPTWSTTTFRAIMREHVPPKIRRLVAIDLHTGLGRFAYGEPIFVGDSAAQFQRTFERFGPEVKNLKAGNAISAVVGGTVAGPVWARTQANDITFLALEFGTIPMMDVLTALRGDHWLHAPGRSYSPFEPQLKAALRDAFYVDAPHWRAAVYGRTADFIVRATHVLNES